MILTSTRSILTSDTGGRKTHRQRTCNDERSSRLQNWTAKEKRILLQRVRVCVFFNSLLLISFQEKIVSRTVGKSRLAQYSGPVIPVESTASSADQRTPVQDGCFEYGKCHFFIVTGMVSLTDDSGISNNPGRLLYSKGNGIFAARIFHGISDDSTQYIWLS